MDKILERIYIDMIQNLKKDEMSLMLEREILQLLKDNGSHLDQEAYERCRDLLFRAAAIGEETGFYRGFRCAVQLFIECGR